MIQKPGSVTITDKEIVVTGFWFAGPVETDCEAEALRWAAERLAEAIKDKETD